MTSSSKTKLGVGEAYSLLVGTWIATGLVLALSIAGLAAPDWTYPEPGLAAAFRANDAVNLIIVLPVLALALNRRQWPSGRMLWAAVLLYFCYNSLVPLLSLPNGIPEAGYLVVFALSGGIAMRLLRTFDHRGLRQSLGGQVSEPWSGGILALFGLIFAGHAIAILLTDGDMGQAGFGLLVADFVFGLGWIVAGLALLFRRYFGYAIGGVGLLQAGLLLAGLLILLVVKPLLDGTPFAFLDLVGILVMSGFFAVPVVLFMVGVRRTERRQEHASDD